MQLIWSAKNLGERPAQIFGRPNFWELRYYIFENQNNAVKILDN